jgi:hypothetical protein
MCTFPPELSTSTAGAAGCCKRVFSARDKTLEMRRTHLGVWLRLAAQRLHNLATWSARVSANHVACDEMARLARAGARL